MMKMRLLLMLLPVLAASETRGQSAETWPYGLPPSSDYALLSEKDIYASNRYLVIERSRATSQFGVVLVRRPANVSRSDFQQAITALGKPCFPVLEAGVSHLGLIDEFVVEYDPALGEDKLGRILENAGATKKRDLQCSENKILVEFGSECPRRIQEEDLVRLTRRTGILRATPNPLLIQKQYEPPAARACTPNSHDSEPNSSMETWPNDYYYKNGYQHYLHLIRAADAWQGATTGSCDVKIAIIDYGVDRNHPDLKEKIDECHDAYYPNGNGLPSGDDAHGTATAGVAAASTHNNKIGIAGASWGGKIVPIRVFDTANQSQISTAGILHDGICQAVLLGADVLNNSWGYDLKAANTPDLDIVRDAIRYAIDHDRVFVASAGNFQAQGDTEVMFPALMSQMPQTSPVISVGATNLMGHLLNNSRYDPPGSVSVVAPGSSIRTTDIQGTAGYDQDESPGGDYYSSYSDTSAAAPFVAGAAALLLSWSPDASAETIKQWIVEGAYGPDAGTHAGYGSGMLDIAKSIDKAGVDGIKIDLVQLPPVRMPFGHKAKVRATVSRIGIKLSGATITFHTSDPSLVALDDAGKPLTTDCDGHATTTIRGTSLSETTVTATITAKLNELTETVAVTVGGPPVP